MPSTETYNFQTLSKYIVPANMEVNNGARLTLVPLPSQSFNQDFSSPSGIILDPVKTEVTGGQLVQKDTTPANALAYASYTNDENFSWANGSLIGALNGSASVTGGYLDLLAAASAYSEYSALNNVPPGNVGAIRIRFRTKYSGSPGGNQYLYISSDGVNNISNFIRIMHTGLNIRWDLYNSAGAVIKTVQTGNTFNPTAGVIYELELNFDTGAGQHRLYIDGANINGVQTGTGTRSQTGGIIRVGANYTSTPGQSFGIEVLDIAIFDAVQHTGPSYTPDWSAFKEARYESDIITLPAFDYPAVGIGDIQSYDGFATIETGSPTYQVDDEPVTPISESAMDVFVPSISPINMPVVKITTPTSNTQVTIDDIQLDYTGQIYPTTERFLEVTDPIELIFLLEFLATFVLPGSDLIGIVLNNGTEWQYHDGASWVSSDQSLSQSNTLAQVQANIATFIAAPINFKWGLVFKSDDGSTTPEATFLEVTFVTTSELAVAVFKEYFDRGQFDYGTALPQVRDKDIERAIAEAEAVINKGLYPSNDILSLALLYLTAHFLSRDIDGESGQPIYNQSSRSADGISESVQIPEWMNQGEFAMYSTTSFGQKFLTISKPYLDGAVISVPGGTNP